MLPRVTLIVEDHAQLDQRTNLDTISCRYVIRASQLRFVHHTPGLLRPVGEGQRLFLTKLIADCCSPRTSQVILE